MLLLENDGKSLLRKYGIATPAGMLLRAGQAPAAMAGGPPWIAKAQVAAGGRGKAGGIKIVQGIDALQPSVDAILELSIKGCHPRAVLVEECVAGQEHYLALMVDAGAGGIRLMYSDQGGIDIESHAKSCMRFNEVAALSPAAIDAMTRRAALAAPAAHRNALLRLGQCLATLFLTHKLTLAEINPLFAMPDGTFIAGDAKIAVDMNAVPTDEMLHSLIANARDLYPDAWLKLTEDFDFVEIEHQGTLGLITTGAGLSMMLVDELVARGERPFNFCDVRTGQLRGSPERLIRILDWLNAAPNVQMVLVNIFAGITNLEEFACLLAQAREQRPGFKIPMIARLVGNGAEAAQRLLAGIAPDIIVEPDLDRCMDLVGHARRSTTDNRSNA
ncbi:ATP-grasp domain-containing protein [Bordetella sp. BOR01]|uniref:ATP-grasp domain-containing protein n=1 Tax=Bordetella sp. BOR01 TaxID=2854779 RepID=UPI001C4877A5|nr:ATP-grasp domain-containing protein [Bordetella sp. BOR01]MBV7484819.1 hypothetical protein [Bordetella sp. BOR01]